MVTEKLRSEDKPVISLAGGVATRNAFVVFDGATTEQLVNAITRVREMEGATQWWLGDIGLALQDRKKKQLVSQAKELRAKASELDGSIPEQAKVKNELLEQAEEFENGAEIKYTAELCEALDIDVGYLKNCVSLARFYPPSCRHDGLGIKHHAAAVTASNRDIQKAQQWLVTAHTERLSAPDLRKRGAEAKATYKTPELPPMALSYDELSRADAWASRFKEKASKLTSDEAIAILSDITELRALISQLESIAKGMS
jgi:hypothetical protein